MGSQGAKGGRNTGLGWGQWGRRWPFHQALKDKWFGQITVGAMYVRGRWTHGEVGTSRALVERVLELRLAWRGELDQGG